MAKPANAFEVLEMLREKTGKQDRKFRDLSQYLDAKAREQGVPLSGQFELTPLCNLNCRMCYVHLTPGQMGGQSPLPVDVWKDLIRQAWEAGMMTATLTGGECLTYPGFEELYLYLHSLGCEVSLLTNGLLLDAERIRFLQAHMPARVRITLYGWNDDVYERVTGKRVFGAVAGNIRRAVEAGLPVSVSLTPNRFLGDDALETLRTAYTLCRSVDVNACIYPPRAETGRSGQLDDPEIELYMRVYRLQNELLGVPQVELDEDALPPYGGPSHTATERGLRCGAGRSSFSVDWHGMMSPCGNMSMLRADPLRDGFAAAWASIRQAALDWPRVPECDGCVYNDVCAKCPANMLRFAEPGEQPLGLCERTKYLVRHGVRHLPACE